MAFLHGSSIPGALEGGPFHNDSFLLSFNSVANTNLVAVYVGALVTVNGTADFTVNVTSSNTDFILGVAQTSGQLQAAIDVICRGEVTVVCGLSVVAGYFLMPSAVAGQDGMVVPTAGPGTTVSRLMALQSVTITVTPLPIVALLY